ncbi:MAG TPA: hypothetical protein VIU62_23895 [Chloroflexota bacterium]
MQRLDAEGRCDWNARYAALLAHYGMEPTKSQAGEAHQNGDVEQSHHRFKLAVDQALRVRGHRDFTDRPSYVRFLQELVTQRNHTRTTRFAAEQAALHPLPAQTPSGRRCCLVGKCGPWWAKAARYRSWATATPCLPA